MHDHISQDNVYSIDICRRNLCSDNSPVNYRIASSRTHYLCILSLSLAFSLSPLCLSFFPAVQLSYFTLYFYFSSFHFYKTHSISIFLLTLYLCTEKSIRLTQQNFLDNVLVKRTNCWLTQQNNLVETEFFLINHKFVQSTKKFVCPYLSKEFY